MWRGLFCALPLVVAGIHTAAADGAAPNVVASLKPVHALVAGVMGDAGTPRLLIAGAASPHTYQMRPSEAKALRDADLVVWIGEDMETFLHRPIANLGPNTMVVTLREAAGMRLLPNREGGVWIAREKKKDHDDHHDGHGHHDDHGHDHDRYDDDDHDRHDDDHDHDRYRDDHDHDHDSYDDDDHDRYDDDHEHDRYDDDHDHDRYRDDHGHDDHGHGHGAFDVHFWLDPGNALRIVEAVTEALVQVDPARAETYRGNARAVQERIRASVAAMDERLAPVRDRRFIVFHDAYQYFEHAFELASVGAVAIDPSRPTGARRLVELREALARHHVRCVFAEPQFEPDLVRTVVEGTEVRTAVLDPLGAEADPGPDAWFEIMDGLADAFVECLGPGAA